MTVDLIERPGLRSGPGAEAPAFRASVRPVSFSGMTGLLHMPTAADEGDQTRDAAVLLCAPLGRDARCAHVFLRLLAERFAAQGCPALRFDYLGCGDALDLPPDADAVATWVGNVREAAAMLRQTTGRRRLALCGLRFGASLCALAAQELADVDGLILLAPVGSGRGWLRELRLAAAMHTPDRSGQPRRPSAPSAALEAEGLQLSEATVRAIAAMDLLKLQTCPPEALVISRPAASSDCARYLLGLGARVVQDDFTGFDTLFDETHSNIAPRGVMDVAARWLSDRMPMSGPPAICSATPALTVADLRPPECTERVVRFGGDLYGVLCLPDHPSASGRAVVFCNTGGDPRTGAGRFSVLAARALARQGFASLRLDFAGLGDSPWPDAGRSHVYETPRRPDLSAAVGVLAAEGFPHPVLLGVCSGAYHALWSAVDDARVTGAVLVSLIKFVWRPGDSLAIGHRDEAGALQAYVGGLRDRRVWARIIRGEVRLFAIARSLAARFAAQARTRLHRRETRAMEARLAAFSARGGRAHFLLGLEDGALDELEAHFGRGGARLTALDGFSVSVDPELDHGLLRAASRTTAIAALLAFLEA